jgi:hypothetical protein
MRPSGPTTGHFRSQDMLSCEPIEAIQATVARAVGAGFTSLALQRGESVSSWLAGVPGTAPILPTFLPEEDGGFPDWNKRTMRPFDPTRREYVAPAFSRAELVWDGYSLPSLNIETELAKSVSGSRNRTDKTPRGNRI